MLPFSGRHTLCQAEAVQQAVDQTCGLLPAKSAETVPSRHKLRAGIENLVLGVARAELRSDRVPRRLEEFYLALRIECRRPLGLADDRFHYRIDPVLERGWQHDQRSASQLADGVDHPRIEILGDDLGGVE